MYSAIQNAQLSIRQFSTSAIFAGTFTARKRRFRIRVLKTTRAIRLLVVLATSGGLASFGRAEGETKLVERPWFAARTPHFETYSCGPTQEVAKLAARLEQFRVAYESLAGTQAVSSPPIEVLALPDHETLEKFVPLYQGQPISLSGFFHRGSDENFIVLSVSNHSAGPLDTIFHEYAHSLLRRNQHIWPMWLNEGMADIYATFEVTGNHSARIGKAQPIYASILAHEPLSPLSALLAVKRNSPEYNERERQGIFYAESWLLTHYLMIGNPARRSGLGQMTVLLRQGQTVEQAFTNAMHCSLEQLEKELRQYQKQGHFQWLDLSVRANLLGAQPMVTRGLSPAETCFRLGDELLRVGRQAEAERYFAHAAKVAPGNPFSYEGRGLLAAQRGQHSQALEELRQAIQRGSRSYLAHYMCAREQLLLNAPAPDTFQRLPSAEAGQVRGELEASLKLMPDFGPAQHLLGFFELLQNEDLSSAGQHLKQAMELEPDNLAYTLTLAELEVAQRDAVGARRTLEQLCLPYVSAPLRTQAEQMLKTIGAGEH